MNSEFRKDDYIVYSIYGKKVKKLPDQKLPLHIQGTLFEIRQARLDIAILEASRSKSEALQVKKYLNRLMKKIRDYKKKNQIR